MEKSARERYEAFVKNHPAGTFFQSWAFGEFQEKIPYRGKSWVLVVPKCHPRAGGDLDSRFRGNDIMASCLVIKMKMRFGKCWLWIPYGPLIEADRSEEKRIEACSGISDDLARIAKEERAVFARIEPATSVSKFLNFPISPSLNRYMPEYSLVLNLEKSEDEILAQMKPKGRYNISTALRHGVSVEQFVRAHKQQHFDDFYQLLKKTAGRDEFGIHPKFFYETLLETFGAAEASSLFLAYKDSSVRGNDKKVGQEVIGGIIVIFYKDTATYYYGASSYEHRNLMAPYLLQWEAIREAKRRGMKKYDFLGIAPPDDKSHPYAGITEFKKKFGGREITYPPAFDIVYKPAWYALLKMKRKA